MPAPSSPPERGACRASWPALREWLAWLNGDVGYARFVAHARSAHPDRQLPSRTEFYRVEVERRWNGIRRCC